jgi:hypothetical protein
MTSSVYEGGFVDTPSTDFSNREIEMLVHDYTPLFDRVEKFLLEKNNTSLHAEFLKFGIDLSNFRAAFDAQTASEGTFVEAVPLPGNFVRVTKDRLSAMLDKLMQQHSIPTDMAKNIDAMCAQLSVGIKKRPSELLSL